MHKYPKTKHLPWSPGRNVQYIDSVEQFINNRIIITEKMDGSNTLINTKGTYTRSLYKGQGEKWDKIESWRQNIAPILEELEDNQRTPGLDLTLSIFGENLYKELVVHYEENPGFLIFAARYDVPKFWLDWNTVKLFASKLNATTVPVLFDGKVDSEIELIALTNKLGNEKSTYGEIREGLVIRIGDGFYDDDFESYVAKWVRKGFHKTHDNPREGKFTEKVARKNLCRYCGNEYTILVKGVGYLCKDHHEEYLKAK